MDAHTLCTGATSDLVPGRLRGYRCWNFRDDSDPPTLTALNFRYGSWPVEQMHAVCMAVGTYVGCTCGLGCCTTPAGEYIPRPEHPAPQIGCGCGLWGWYRPDETRLTQGVVFGAVNASGRTLLGDYGFRAEHADIVALAYDGPQRVRDGLHRRYQVPVFTDPEHLAEHFPPDDVRSLVPTAFISEPAVSGYLSRTQLFRSAVDPYLHPEIELDGEPIWHYQLHSIMNVFLFSRQEADGFQVELVSRFTAHRVVSQDPQIISLYITSPMRPFSVREEVKRRSAAMSVFVQQHRRHDEEPPPQEPPDPKQVALEHHRQRPTGPWRNPFSRLGRRW